MRVLVALVLSAAQASDWGSDWSAPRAPPGGYPPQYYQSQQQPPPPPPPQWGGAEQYSPRPAEENAAGPAPSALEDKYLATASGRVMTRAASAAVSGGIGLGLSKAIMGSPNGRWAACGAAGALVCTVCGGRPKELALALGVTTMEAFSRERKLSRSGRYPIFKQCKAALGLAPRRNFPPSGDPWKYKRDEGDLMAPDFSMIKCLVAAMALGGLTVSAAPLPKWAPSSLCGLVASGATVFGATLRDARGDALRCVLARCVALVGIAWSSAGDANLGTKAAAAASLSAKKLATLDQQTGASKAFGKFARRAASAAASAAADAQRGGDDRKRPRENGDRRPPDSDQYRGYGAEPARDSRGGRPPPNEGYGGYQNQDQGGYQY